MIGNDIVDLRLAKSAHRWREQRFQEKVFCEQEQNLITQVSDPFGCLWRFWTMKESAYKVFKQTSPESTFSPISFTCRLLTDSMGMVNFGSTQYKMQTFSNKLFIYSFCTDHQSNIIENQYFTIQEHKTKQISRYIYRKILLKIADHDSEVYKQMELKKNEHGVPIVYYKNKKLPISISISHHGHFAAYAIAASTKYFLTA